MLECNDIFYISAYKLLCSSLKSLCNRVYTANSWNDPDLITDTDFSVCSAVAVKVYMPRWLYVLASFWFILIMRDYKDEVPGACAKDCGNYLDMNLPMANWLADRFLREVLDGIGPERLVYPE